MAWSQAPVLEKSINAQESQSIRGVAFKDDSGDIFAADSQNGAIYRYDDILGQDDLSSITSGFSFPVGGSLGDLGWADEAYLMCVARDENVDEYDPFGGLQETFTPFDGPVSGVAVNGSTIYVSNGEGSEVRVFERRAERVVDVVLTKTIFAAGSRIIHGMAYDESQRRMWVSDDDRKLIMAFDDVLDNPDQAVAAPSLSFDAGVVDYFDMEFSQQLGIFYMCTGNRGDVIVYNRQGVELETFNSGLGFCAGLAAHGNRIWVSDLGDRINVFRRAGAGNYVLENSFNVADCGFLDPSLAYDPVRDSLWVWTWENNGFCQLDPESGALIGGRFAQDVNRPGPYGHSLSFAAGKLIEGTETFSTDALRVWTIVDEVSYERRFEFPLPNLGRTGLAFDTDRNSLWVISYNDGNPGDIFEYNPTNGQLKNQFTTPLPGPWGTGFSYGARKCYQGTETAGPDQIRVIGFGCTRDDQCPEGQVCRDNQCVDRVCNTNADCLDSQYCHFDGEGDQACLAPGICTARPGDCPNDLNEVCGCDNITYDNACQAAALGVSVQLQGACPECRTDDDCPIDINSGRNVCEPSDFVCVECYLDNHCGDNEVCDIERNTCIDRPCDDNGDCTDTQYCHFEGEDDDTCGGNGICEDRPNDCPDVDAPVCGCDDTTYGNACEAAAAGVTVLENNACPECRGDDDCPVDLGSGRDFCEPDDLVCVECHVDAHCGELQICNTNENVCIDRPCNNNGDCPTAQFCRFRGDNESLCSGEGTCDLRPVDCPNVNAPVCGCDNTSYLNACEAERRGITVRGDGNCPQCRNDDDCPQDDFPGDYCEPEDNICVECYVNEHCDDGELCDLDRNVCIEQPCESNDDCPHDRYCQFSGLLCGGGGSCAERPMACDNTFEPVCGCDNNTYSNACRAANTGVSLRGLGACPECRNDDDCPQDDFPGDYCEPADNICVDCYLDNHCNDDEFCDLDVNICRFRCSRDDECGDGEICDDFICREGCRANPDCEGNQVCDPDRLVCVPGLECRRDSQCSDGEICDEFICREGCRVNEDCDGDQVCDPNRLICVQDFPCHRDDDCGDGEICDEFICREGCRATADCDDNQVCDPDRLVCVPGVECTRDEQCADDEICDDFICREGCRVDEDCNEDQVCDPDRLVCIPAPECTRDEQCADDEICDDLICREGCRVNEDCDENQVCDAERLVCIPGVQCNRDEECADDEICEEFICREGCRTDEDCEETQRCDPERLVCVPRPPCGEDSDCPEGQECNELEGVCVDEPECDSDDDCPEGEVCDPETQQCGPETPCITDEDCPEGERCGVEQVCEGICDSDDDCLSGEVCTEDGLCEEVIFTVQGTACLCATPSGDTPETPWPLALLVLGAGAIVIVRRRR